MKKTYTTFLMLFFVNVLFSQAIENTVTINITTNEKYFDQLTLRKYGISSLLNFDPNHKFSLSPFKTNTFSFAIPYKSFYGIPDGYFDHQIFLQPGDTINIEFEKINIKKEKSRTFHKMHVKAKYSGNITFFDDIYKLLPLPIRYGQVQNESAIDYKIRCEDAFNKIRSILNTYKKNGLVSDDFIEYATKEIEAKYIMSICEILIQKEKKSIPDIYFKDLQSYNFSDSIYSMSNYDYTTASHVSVVYLKNIFNPQKPFSNLSNEYNTIKNIYSGIVKDKIMANSINQYIDKEYPAFDSIYNDFLMECKNSSIRQEVINKVEAFKLIPKIILTDLFNWNSVLNNTILIDSENNKTKLKDIFTEDKIYILDCWATWCGPCIQQLPFINNIAKKYKDSVVFVSISFDQDEALWRKHIIKNESNIKYQYNIYNHFNSQFSKYFDLKTIPRYILVSKTGNKIINNKMPYPFLQKEFERILKQNL